MSIRIPNRPRAIHAVLLVSAFLAAPVARADDDAEDAGDEDLPVAPPVDATCECDPSILVRVLGAERRGNAPVTPRVFAGSTELTPGVDGRYRVPLKAADGRWVVDAFSKHVVRALPKGAVAVFRRGGGTFHAGVTGFLPKGGILFVDAEFELEGATFEGATNLKQFRFEKQGDGKFKKLKPGQDEFSVLDADTLRMRATVTGHADLFSATLACAAPPDLCAGVLCTALDACHDVGTCDPATGACTNPVKADGAACDDGDACTRLDTCFAGTCVGDEPVTCTALDACHAPGACDPATGLCLGAQPLTDTPCDDGDACTRVDVCSAGTCVGTDDVTCGAPGRCATTNTCNPIDGECYESFAEAGAACSDGNTCTLADACDGNGACVPGATVVCASDNPCLAAFCDPVTGCATVAANEGGSCEDGLACTTGSTCQAGSCTATRFNTCNSRGTCGEPSGACTCDAGFKGTWCQTVACGDGTVDPGEACDDGAANSNTTGGACRRDCTLPSCGDGVVDPGEACDAGNANSDSAPDACRTDCSRPSCGDGIVDTGESCDAGAANSDVAPDACRTSCRRPSCGDGIQDSGEACDDGPSNSDTVAGACRRSCVLPRCGDAVVDPGEQCDAGKLNSDTVANACRRTCVRASCGDGVVDGRELCDDGPLNSDKSADACRKSCTPARCGDGILDSGEACDWGVKNSDSTSGACRTTCVFGGCGDGVVDPGEDCDNGAANSDSVSGACRVACRFPSCGDGVVDPGEGCDDVNKVVGDGCAPGCVAETAPVRPKTCVETSTAFCADYRFIDTLSELAAYLGNNPITGEAPASASIECAEYYARACGSCPATLTVGTCGTMDDVAYHPLCEQAALFPCASILAEECPVGTLEDCANPGFVSQSPFLAGSVPACADRVRAQCRALQEANCPAITTEFCFDAFLDPALVPSGCGSYVSSRCDDLFNAACPVRSETLCTAVDAGASGVHPACESRAQLSCSGDWVRAICEPTMVLTVTATRCMQMYDTLDHPSLSALCAGWLSQRCNELVAASTDAAADAAGACESALVRENGGDYAIDVVRALPGRLDCRSSQRLDVPIHLQPYAPTPVEEFAVGLELLDLQRELGGASVRDCSEYAQQKFWNYTAFERLKSKISNDPRLVFQLAYSNAPSVSEAAIGFRAKTWGADAFKHYLSSTTLSDGGTSYSLGAGSEDAMSPKNEYVKVVDLARFQSLKSALLARDPPSLFDPDDPASFIHEGYWSRLVRRMENLRDHWYRTYTFGPNDGWHWHERMSRQLSEAGVTDEELSHRYKQRKAFFQLLEERDAANEQVRFLQANLGKPFVSFLSLQNAQARLDAIDDQVAAHLEEANRLGCFSATYDSQGNPLPSVCDWAPQDFVDDVDALFRRGRVRNLAKCRKWAPADLSSLVPGYSFLTGDPPQWASFTADATATVGQFDIYLDRRIQTVGLLSELYGSMPEENRPVWHQEWGDADEIGDRAWFAAGYSYGASWDISTPPNREGLCGINATADAHLETYAYVIDNKVTFVDAGLQVDVRNEVYETHLRLLGLDVWNEAVDTSQGPVIPELAYDFSLAYSAPGIEAEDRAAFSAPVFSLAGIDIVVNAGAAGRVGMDLAGGLRLTVANVEDCGPGLDVGLFARVRPYGALDGFIEFGIDLFVVEVGVGGSLTLVDAALPFEVSVSAVTPGILAAVEADLDVAARADLEAAMLGGKLYVYADTWWDTYKYTFFEWQGYEWTEPLFVRNYSTKLGAAVDYCAITGINCR